MVHSPRGARRFFPPAGTFSRRRFDANPSSMSDTSAMRVQSYQFAAFRRMERAGVPRSTAMKLSGHKTEAIYRRYAIVSESDLREGTKKIAAKMKAEAKG